MKQKPRFSAILSMLVLLSHTLLPSAAVVYAETQRELAARSPDEQLVFKKEDKIVSSKEDKDPVEVIKDEDVFLTLHREDKEARDIRVELPEEIELDQEKTATANQTVAEGITQYQQEKAYQAAQALQVQYQAEAEETRQAIAKEAASKEEEIRKQAEQDGTDPTEAITQVQAEKEQKLAAVSVRQAEVAPVTPVDSHQLVEFKKKDEEKQETRKLIFHFQEGQTDVGMVLKTTKPGNYSLTATYEKEDKKYRSYPVRLKAQEVPAPSSEETTKENPPTSSNAADSSNPSGNAGEKPSTNQKVDGQPASESTEKKEETDKSESKEEKTEASSEDKETSDKGKSDKEETDNPTESPDKAKEESDKDDKAKKDKKETDAEIEKKKKDFIDRSRALTGRSSFFAAGDLTEDRTTNTDLNPEDFLVSYQPRRTTIQAGESLVYDLKFRVSGALINDIKNVDVTIHILPKSWSSPVPAAKLVSKLEDLAVFGVRPIYDESNQTLNYHFPSLSPAISGVVPVIFETKNGTTVNNTKIEGRTVSKQRGRVFEETNADDVYIQSESPTVNVTKAADGKVSVHQGETIKWKIRATFRGSATGTQFIKEGSKIRIIDSPEDGQTITDANKVSELTAPSYAEQEKNLKEKGYLFTIEKTVETKVPGNIIGSSFGVKRIYNTARLEASSLEGTNDVTATSNKADIAVVKEAIGAIPPIEGEFIVPVNRGPRETGLNTGQNAADKNKFENKPGLTLEFETLTSFFPWMNHKYPLKDDKQDLSKYWYYKAWSKVHQNCNLVKCWDAETLDITNASENFEEVVIEGTNDEDTTFNPLLNPYTLIRLNQFVDSKLNIKAFNIYLPATSGREEHFSDFTTYDGMSPEYSHYYPSGRVYGRDEPAEGDGNVKLPDGSYTSVFNGSDINARVEALPIKIDYHRPGDLPGDPLTPFIVDVSKYAIHSAKKYGWPNRKYITVPIEDLGLTTADHIADFRIIYGDHVSEKYKILPWFTGGVVTEYVVNDSDYDGPVINSSSIDGHYLYHGEIHKFTRRARLNKASDVIAPDGNTGPREATIVKLPEKTVLAQVTPRFVLKNDGNVIRPGLNRIEVSMNNLPDSTGSIYRHIKSSIWLPQHVHLADKPNFTYDGKDDQGSYKVYPNWRGTGRDLVVVTFKKDQLDQDKQLKFQADVIVGADADKGNEDENISLEAYAGSTWTTFQGNNLVGDYYNPDGTINQDRNFLQDRNIKNITQGKRIYKFVNDDELKMEKFIRVHKDPTDDTGWLKGAGGKNNIVVVKKGGLIDYKIIVRNNSPSERPINRMVLIDQFPKAPTVIEKNDKKEVLDDGDKTVLSGVNIPGIPTVEDKQRDSAFTPTLTGPIQIKGEQWQYYLSIGLISILYSKSNIPEKKWLTDDVVNAGYLREENDGDNPYPTWTDQDDTEGWTDKDWKAVRAFMIVKEKGREILKEDGPLELTYTMKAPETVLDDNKDAIAWNSIAGTMNGLSPVEATKVGAMIPGNTRDIAFRVKKTDTEGTKPLDAVLVLYRVDQVEDNGKLTEREVEIGRLATKSSKDYLPLYDEVEKIVRSAEVEQTYVLRELATQNGYVLPSQGFRFKVKGDGSLTQVNDPQTAGLLTITSDKVRDGKPLAIDESKITISLDLKNTKLTQRKLKKVDAEDTSKVLAGASFKLAASKEDAAAKKFLQHVTRTVTGQVGKETYTSKQEFVVTKDDPIYTDKNKEDKEAKVTITDFKAEDYTVTTGKDGLAVFDHLNLPENVVAGSLWAVETKAPDGYRLNQEAIELPVKGREADGTTLVKNSSSPLAYYVRVRKVDAETDQGLDARFYLYHFINGRWEKVNHGNTKRGEEADISGRQQLQANAQHYELFKIEEKTEPDGYAKLPADIYFRYYDDEQATIQLVTSDDKEITAQSSEPYKSINNWVEVDISRETDKKLTGPHAVLNEGGKDRTVRFKIRNKKMVTAKIYKVDGSHPTTKLEGVEFRLADSWANAKAGKFLKLETIHPEWHDATEQTRYHWTAANSTDEAQLFKTDGEGQIQVEHLDPDLAGAIETIPSDEEIEAIHTEPEKSKAKDKAQRLKNTRHYYLVETKAPAGYAQSAEPIPLVMKTKQADHHFDMTVENWRDKYMIRVSKLDKADPNKSLDARFYLHHFVNGQWQEVSGAHANTKNGDREVNISGDLTLQPNSQGYDLYKIEERTEPAGYAKLSTDIYFRIYRDSRVELVTNEDKVITDQSPEPYRSLKNWVEIDHKTAEKDHAVLSDDKSKMEIFFKLYNSDTVTARVRKVDSSDRSALPGAEFRLADSLENARAGRFLKLETTHPEWHDTTEQTRYHWITANSTDEAQLFTADEKGRFDIQHLNSALLKPLPTAAELEKMSASQKQALAQQAHYYLVETKAPNGYPLPAAPIPLVMTEKGADNGFDVEIENALNTYIFKATKVDADNPETKLDARFYVHHWVNGQWQWIQGARAQTSGEENKPLTGNITLNPNQDGYEFFKIEEKTPAPDHEFLPSDIYFRLYTDGHITFVTEDDKEITSQSKQAIKDLQKLVSVDFTTQNAAGQTVYKAKRVDNRMEVYFRIKNKPQIKAKIHKVETGYKNISLAGAEFRLADSLEHAKAGIFLKEVETKHTWWGEEYNNSRYHWEVAQNSDEAALFTTGDDGRVDIAHLNADLLAPLKENAAPNTPHYYLVETKSPKGYMRNTDPIPLVMKDHGQDNSFDFEVENTKPAPFPRTGGIGMAVFVLSGLTLMTIGVLAKRRQYATHRNKDLS